MRVARGNDRYNVTIYCMRSPSTGMKIITIGRTRTTEIPKRPGLVSPSSATVCRDRTGVVKIHLARGGGRKEEGGGERRGDEFRQQIGFTPADAEVLPSEPTKASLSFPASS